MVSVRIEHFVCCIRLLSIIDVLCAGVLCVVRFVCCASCIVRCVVDLCMLYVAAHESAVR